LAIAIKEKPDLIISDVMMPKISGFDMLDILRSTPETKDMKVVMMTALSSEEQRSRGETLGANRYLVKSQVGIEDVVRAVHDVLADIPVTETPASKIFSTPPISAAMTARPAQPSAPSSSQPNATPTQPVSEPVVQPNPTLPTTPPPEPAVPTVEPETPSAEATPEPTPEPLKPVAQPTAEPAAPPTETETVSPEEPTPEPISAPTAPIAPPSPLPSQTPAMDVIEEPKIIETAPITTPIEVQQPHEPNLDAAPNHPTEPLATMPPQPQMAQAEFKQPAATEEKTSPTMTQFGRPSVTPTPYSPPELETQGDKTINPVENNFPDINEMINKELENHSQGTDATPQEPVSQ
jgi:hypothetical protein